MRRAFIPFALFLACASSQRAPTPRAPVCVEGPVTQEVSFPSADGLLVSATYRSPCGTAPRPVVVLAHQLCRDRSEWAAWVRVLLARDIATLAIDLRGHGQSRTWPDGSTRDLCEHARDLVVSSAMQDVPVVALYAPMANDLRAAVAWVRRECKATAIALVGSSIGANSALVVAADDPSVSAVVALSPGLDTRGIKTEKAVVALGDRPVWLEAAEDDPGGAATLRQLARENVLVRTVIWPTGGHGNDMLVAHPEELAALVDFVVAHLER